MKKKLGPEYIKRFKELIEKWEDYAEEEPDDGCYDFTSYEEYNAGITCCVWELEDFLKEHFEDWSEHVENN
jgi:hypothetical protein